MKKFKVKNLGFLIGIIAIIIIMLVGAADELVTYTTEQTKYAAKDTSIGISETISSQLAGNTEIANSITEDEEIKKVEFKKALEMVSIASPTAVGAEESSMSTIVKKSGQKYLFGGSEDIAWTSAYTGGTNSSVGSCSLSPYLQINTWGTWVSYGISSATAVNFSGYSTLVFEVVSTSGIGTGGYANVDYGTASSYTSCTLNSTNFKLTYNVSSISSDKIMLNATNGANIKVKAVYLVQSNYTGETINSRVTINAKDEYLTVDETVDIDIVGNSKIRLYKADVDMDQSKWSWKSLNEDIATVDANGVITGKSIGVTSIIAQNSTASKRVVVKVSKDGNIAQPKIAGGYKHFAAIKSDGTVWTWGYNARGQLGTGNTSDVSKPQKVSSITNAIDVTCAYQTTYVLKSDGTVWGTGLNIEYQLGDGTTTTSKVFKKINGLSDIIQITACHGNCYALKSDGTVWVWGYNSWGQLGDGTTTNKTSVVRMSGVSNIIQISAGYCRLEMLDVDGNVWAVGYNVQGQFGNGTRSNSAIVKPVKVIIAGKKVKEVSAGIFHTIFLMEDGTVYTAGYNGYGQLGTGGTSDSLSPYKVSNISNAKHVYAEGFSSYITRNTTTAGIHQGMYVAGVNSNGVLYNNSTNNITTFTITQTDKEILSIGSTIYDADASVNSRAIVDSYGRVYTVGGNDTYQLGDTTTSSSTIPEMITKEEIKPTQRIINIEKVNDTAKIECLYNVDFNLLYSNLVADNLTYTSLDTSVATVTEDGTITAISMGSTVIRIYDQNKKTYSSVRVKVNGEGNITQPKIAGGWNHFAAVKADGFVWVWGYNSNGQLGTGNTTNVTKPQKALMSGSSMINAVDVACSKYTTFILKSDGA